MLKLLNSEKNSQINLLSRLVYQAVMADALRQETAKEKNAWLV